MVPEAADRPRVRAGTVALPTRPNLDGDGTDPASERQSDYRPIWL